MYNIEDQSLVKIPFKTFRRIAGSLYLDIHIMYLSICNDFPWVRMQYVKPYFDLMIPKLSESECQSSSISGGILRSRSFTSSSAMAKFADRLHVREACVSKI